MNYFIMKKFLIAACAAGVLLFSSCAAVKSPVTGFVYQDVTSGNHATSNALGSKVGRASVKSILGIYSSGDASIQAAAKSAGITKISHVDEKAHNILGIVATYEVIVYGE